MILSIHLADAGSLRAIATLRERLSNCRVPEPIWAQRAFTVPLAVGPRRPPVPDGTALLAAWSDDETLDTAITTDERLSAGWHARLRPLRSVGTWSGLPGLPRADRDTATEAEADDPVAVLTLGRLRLRRTVPFVRASHPAELQALADPAVVFGTALACPPRIVATFSLWRTTREMRRYATGTHQPHLDAMRAHTRSPFHHESLFARFRPYGSIGTFHGRDLMTGKADL